MAKKSMIARETKRQKLVQKYAANARNLNKNFAMQHLFVKLYLFTANSRAYRVIVRRYAYITVVQRLADQKVFIVILVFHVMYYVKWHTNVSFQEFVKQVGKRHFLWLFET